VAELDRALVAIQCSARKTPLSCGIPKARLDTILITDVFFIIDSFHPISQNVLWQN